MGKEEFSTISVEFQSLEDAAQGRLLFNGVADELEKAGLDPGELLSIGVLEGGTVKGNPSIMLLIKVKYKVDGKDDYFYTAAQVTGKNFLTAAKIVNTKLEWLLAKAGKRESLS